MYPQKNTAKRTPYGKSKKPRWQLRVRYGDEPSQEGAGSQNALRTSNSKNGVGRWKESGCRLLEGHDSERLKNLTEEENKQKRLELHRREEAITVLPMDGIQFKYWCIPI